MAAEAGPTTLPQRVRPWQTPPAYRQAALSVAGGWAPLHTILAQALTGPSMAVTIGPCSIGARM